MLELERLCMLLLNNKIVTFSTVYQIELFNIVIFINSCYV